MRIQFKDTDNQVAIQTEFNTRHIYLTPDYEIERRRTLVAIRNQKTAGLRRARDTWTYRLNWTKAYLRPSVVAANIKLRFKYWLHRRMAVVRHYVLLTRLIRRYSI